MDFNSILKVLGYIFLIAIAISILVIPFVLMALKKPKEAARPFLDALIKGDAKAAYEACGTEFKKDFTPEKFSALFANKPNFSGEKAKFRGGSIQNDTCILNYVATATDKTSYPVNLTLMKEAGEWKVVGYEIG